MITKAFGYTGSYQLFTTPVNFDASTPARVHVEGAAGGPTLIDSLGHFAGGASGGLVEGDLTLSASQALYVFIGGGGQFTGGTASHAGGFNGGGATPPVASSGSGGGASDIRIGSTTLAARAVVAGGGGGASSTLGTPGQGGGLTGAAGAGSLGGGGGTQSAGGAAGAGTGGTVATAGALGVGGTSAVTSFGGVSYAGGAGGGGYFGGGGGGKGSSGAVGPGGGGSSYVAMLTGFVVDTQGGGAQGWPNTADPVTGGFWPSVGRNGTVTITYNLVPNAPTPNSPVGGRNFDLTLDALFVWTFSDDDPTDSQTAYELQYRIGGGSWVTTGKVASTLGLATVAAGTFAPGDVVEWQVRTWDESDAVSTWSTSAFATACTPPATSFVFDPALTGIASRQPVITGGRSDSTPIAQYQARVVNDVAGAPGATVLADTGAKTVEAGTTALTVTLPDVAYVNSSSYHVLVKIAYPANVWQHTWTDSGPLAANIQPPPAPLVSVDFDPDCAAVTLEWTNPVPTDPALTAVSVDVTRTEKGITERIAAGLPVNSSTVDPIPAGSISGLDVDYRVIAYTATGATASSA